jgi:hypothetical protein
VAKSKSNGQTTPPRSKRDVELGISRLSAAGQIISAFAGLLTVALAMYALTATDMLRANIGLLAQNGDLRSQGERLRDEKASLESGKLDLVFDNGRLRDTQQTLREQGTAAELDLKNMQAERARLLGLNRTIRDELATRTVEVASASAKLRTVEADATALRANSAVMSNSLSETTTTLLRAAMKAHLATYQPTLTEAVDWPVYSYLMDPRSLVSVAGHGATSFTVFAAPESEFDGATLPKSCRVNAAVRAIGLISTSNGNNISLHWADANNTLLIRICSYLGFDLRRAHSHERGIDTLYDKLRMNKDYVVESFITGEYDGLSYEEFKLRGFWLPALGNLFSTEIFSTAKSQGLSLPDIDPRALTLPYSFDLSKIISSSGAVMEKPSLNPLRSRFHQMDAEWVEFLKKHSIAVGFADERIMNGDTFRIYLPRFSINQVGTVEFYLYGQQLRIFDNEVRCVAEAFRSEHPVYAIAFDPAAEACSETERIRLLTRNSFMKRKGIDAPLQAGETTH